MTMGRGAHRSNNFLISIDSRCDKPEAFLFGLWGMMLK